MQMLLLKGGHKQMSNVIKVSKTLLQRLLDAGYPKEDIHHHESDLYIFKTPLTTKVLEEWCEANGWNVGLVKQKNCLFDIFTDQITGRKMYDIAFQYYEMGD